MCPSLWPISSRGCSGKTRFYSNLAELHYAFVALFLGRLDEATAFAKSYLGAAEHFQNKFLGADARALLIVCHTRRGELGLAEAIAIEVGDPVAYPFYQSICLLSAIAELRLSQGKAEEAARLAGQALAMVRGPDLSISKHEIDLPLVHVLALRACGDQAAFAAALAEAKAEILARGQDPR